MLLGTEIVFDENVECELSFGIGILPNKKIGQRLARFRQINVDNALTHHDARASGPWAMVLQLPIAALLPPRRR